MNKMKCNLIYIKILNDLCLATRLNDLNSMKESVFQCLQKRLKPVFITRLKDT